MEQGDAGTGGGRGMRGRYGIEGGWSGVVRGGRGSEGEGRRGKGMAGEGLAGRDREGGGWGRDVVVLGGRRCEGWSRLGGAGTGWSGKGMGGEERRVCVKVAGDARGRRGWEGVGVGARGWSNQK